jgi:putative ABC transport system permease protein
VLGASLDAPARATALGRLRSLGLADPDVRRVLAGELVAPVLAGVPTGLVSASSPPGRPSARSGSTR